MKKVVFYPFSENSLFTSIYMSKLLPDLVVSHLVSVNGAGLAGKKAGYVCNLNIEELTVTDDIERALEKCDILLVSDGNLDDFIHKNSLDVIEYAIEKEKDIICALKLKPEQAEMFKNKSKLKNISFIYTGNIEEEIIESEKLYRASQSYYMPKTPIICISGIFETLDNYNYGVLLSLVENLRQDGYKCSGIVTNTEGKIIGMYPFNIILKDKNYSEIEKINLYSNFLKHIEEKEKPDVLLLQIPGGLMAYDCKINNNFGIYAFYVSKILKPDFFMYTVAHNIDVTQNIESLNKEINELYGFKTDCVINTNQVIDILYSKSSGTLSTMYEKIASYNENVINQQSGIPIYEFFNKHDLETLYQQILDKLS